MKNTRRDNTQRVEVIGCRGESSLRLKEGAEGGGFGGRASAKRVGVGSGSFLSLSSVNRRAVEENEEKEEEEEEEKEEEEVVRRTERLRWGLNGA